MDVSVRYFGGKRFEIAARGHRILTDQPVENQGEDSAMTPPELFLSAVGACAGHYAAEYLQARGLDAGKLEIHVSGEKGDRPVRIVSLDIDVIVPCLADRYREGLLRAVNLCLIKNTLLAPPAIEVRLTTSTESLEHVPALQ